jgi:hypothetical protein
MTTLRSLVVIVMAALALSAISARADVRVKASQGGQVGPFLDMFEEVRQSGEPVIIDDPCLSACTPVLSIVPNDRICVTRRAVLGFHTARSIDRRGHPHAEPEASQEVLHTYPAPVQDWINRRGSLTSRLLLSRETAELPRLALARVLYAAFCQLGRMSAPLSLAEPLLFCGNCMMARSPASINSSKLVLPVFAHRMML